MAEENFKNFYFSLSKDMSMGYVVCDVKWSHESFLSIFSFVRAKVLSGPSIYFCSFLNIMIFAHVTKIYESLIEWSIGTGERWKGIWTSCSLQIHLVLITFSIIFSKSYWNSKICSWDPIIIINLKWIKDFYDLWSCQWLYLLILKVMSNLLHV